MPGIFIQICPLTLSKMILNMILGRGCVGEIHSTKYEYTWLGTHVTPTFQLPSTPKLFKTFGMCLEDSGSEDLTALPTELYSHNPLKTFRMFREVSAANVAGRGATR